DESSDENIIIIEEREGAELVEENENDEKVEKSRVEVLLQLGKWFSDETLDDNWLARLLPKTEGPGKQRIPLPGIRFLPVKKVPSADNSKATFSWTLLFDLLSLGVDIRGTTKNGLTFVQGLSGYFGLGAVEVRLALKLSLEDFNKQKDFFDRVAIG